MLIASACAESGEPSGGTGGAGTGGGGTGGVAGMGGNCPTGTTFNPGDAPDRNMVAANEICQRLAEIQCAAERCCCPDGNARKYDSEQACISSQRNICMQIDTETVATDSRSGFSATRLNTAFAEFEQLAASCDLGIVNWGTSQEGFAGVLEGTVASGGTCWTPLTQGADPAAIASCGSVNACTGTSIVTDPTWTCAPRLGAGAACLVDPSCQETLFCANAPTTSNTDLGTCMARLADGSSCERATECQSLFCVGGQCVAPSVEAAYCLKP